MSEPIQPVAQLGDTTPTAERLVTARRLAALHRRVCVPEAVCWMCLRRWPCNDIRWVQTVLRRAEERGA